LVSRFSEKRSHLFLRFFENRPSAVCQRLRYRPFPHLHFKFQQPRKKLKSIPISNFRRLAHSRRPPWRLEKVRRAPMPAPRRPRYRPLSLTRFSLSSAQATHGRRSWSAAGRGPKSASSTAGAGPGSRPPRGTWRRKPPLAARPPCRRPFGGSVLGFMVLGLLPYRVQLTVCDGDFCFVQAR
jgi:hypothetical protein